ncbi:MAG: hypothetical protein QXE79_01885 [Candidatus Bathyarchaeia archaeon]
MVEESKEVNEVDKALLESIDEGLLALGVNVRQVLYLHLERHYKVGRDDIPKKVEDLHEVLEELLGDGGGVLEKFIARRFYSRLGLDFVDHKGWTLTDYVSSARKICREK